jgi:hypothetical protein
MEPSTARHDRDIRSHSVLARSRCVLARRSVTAVFIGLAIVMPERVERTMMDIPTRIVTAVAAN